MRTQYPPSLKTLCLAVLLCATGAARADIHVYTNATDFMAAVSAPGIDTYDDLRVQQYGDTLLRNAGSYDYRAYSYGALWGAGGPGDYWLSNNTQADTIVFSDFSGGVSAFGGQFFASDIAGQFLPSGSLTLTASDGDTLSYTLDGATATSFLGFVSTSALESVTLQANGSYWPTANNVVLAVPEPATYGMLLAGLGVFGLAARRRR